MNTGIFNFTVLFLLVAGLLPAQNVLWQTPGATKLLVIDESSAPVLSNGSSITSWWLKNYEKPEMANGVMVADSLHLYVTVSPSGEVTHSWKRSGSQKVLDQSVELFGDLQFKNTDLKPGRYLLVLTTGNRRPEAITPFEADEVPLNKMCQELDSENNLFQKSCYNYFLEEKCNIISRRYVNDSLIGMGRLELIVIVGTRGKVIWAGISGKSVNGGLADAAIADLRKTDFPVGALKKKDEVNMLLSLNIFSVGLDPEASAQSYALKARELYEKGYYAESEFAWYLAQFKRFEFTCEDYKMAGLSSYYAGNLNQANLFWARCFKEEEAKGKKISYAVEGDEVTLTLVDGERSEDQKDDRIFNFAVVEKRPVFPGCEKLSDDKEQWDCFNTQVMSFIGKNFVYPVPARQQGVQGRMFVNFVIERNGTVNEVRMARGVDPLLDVAGLLVVCKLPKMDPAFQRGKAVRMQYTLPINARLK